MKKNDNIIATQGLSSLFAGQTDIDSTEKKVELIKTKLREFFNLKNVNFLLVQVPVVELLIPCLNFTRI